MQRTNQIMVRIERYCQLIYTTFDEVNHNFLNLNVLLYFYTLLAHY